ncbi:acyl-coenzyme A synthetase ACSM3, mitochondrial-like [Sceloporus undulatus]|uniref:acyl-coenzyme A synthetase ACSM3, mitochondrial-like n=1 Tax=Sceloporus undulatus TaxID=8520 RepID=UPI001C4CF81A|nr:acyl-coenzyme A synthetase ACSM3, mitochondrial-like [Sceloporus undulatus]
MKLLSKLPPVLKSASAPKWPYPIKSQASSGLPFIDFSEFEDIYKNVPEHFNFAKDVLDKWSQKEKDGKRPSNPALWWVDETGEEVRWSFEELGFHSRKVANALSEGCNLQKGERLLVILPRIPEWWLVTVGCLRAGIIYIPATIQLTAKDILYRLQVSKAKCIVTNDALAPLVDSVASECSSLKSRVLVSKGKRREGWLNFHDLVEAAHDNHQPVKTKSQDPMSIFFTSGTTGYPKMVQHSCSSLGIGLNFSGRSWMNLNPSSTMWGVSDTGWVKFVFGSLYGTWSQGACVFSHGKMQFDSTVVLNCLSKYPVTTFCGTPTIFRMLLKHDVSRYKFKSLKTCLSGGEPINPEVMGKWKAQTGLEIYEGYGQSETILVCGTTREMEVKPGFMGKPLPPFDVQIIDEHGKHLPPGEEGDIAIRIKPERPLGLFSGYLDDPVKTASTERGDFYITGDRGIMAEDGYIRFIARADDVILSSGYRIGPFEVEYALSEHPAVAETAVISSPDAIRGEVVKALIILTPAYESHDKDKLIRELQEHVKKTTAPYKYPRKIEFVQDLPKTISGKIQRKELRRKEWEKAQ